MRHSLAIAAVLAFAATGAMAQTPPAQNGPNNGAINSKQQQVDAPVKGRNSFTEGEAKSRIEAKGFTNVSKLQKDNDGVWRGTAMRNGTQTDVALDFQGNVVAGMQGSTTGTTTPGNAGR